MENDGMKKCPYCAEMIKAEAVKCRYCGSMLNGAKAGGLNLGSPRGYWHRVNEGKKIAGVCTGIAAQFDAPVLILPLRVFFVVSTIFYGFGPIFYILLWILMPPAVDDTQKDQGTVSTPAGVPEPPMVQHYPGGAKSAAASPPETDEDSGQEKKTEPQEAGGSGAGSPAGQEESAEPEK